MGRVITTLESMNYIKIVRKPGMDSTIHILDRSKFDQT